VRLTRALIILWALSLPATALAQEAGRVAPPLPNPVLAFLGTEEYEADGKQWTRYIYAVDNRAAYPDALFVAAPELPPCGRNTKASRTWVQIYEPGGKPLYGFCGLSNHEGLGRLWFALEQGVLPPSWIYVEITDRKTNSKYKSNLAETTL
jgi:hypothetical protein